MTDQFEVLAKFSTSSNPFCVRWTNSQPSDLDEADFQTVARAMAIIRPGECVHSALEYSFSWTTEDHYDDALDVIKEGPDLDYSEPGVRILDAEPSQFIGWQGCREDVELRLHDLLLIRRWTGTGAVLLDFPRPTEEETGQTEAEQHGAHAAEYEGIATKAVEIGNPDRHRTYTRLAAEARRRQTAALAAEAG